MRKRSDLDLNKYNQLVVADESSPKPKYQSVYRGRVQDRQVSMAYLPMYELSFERSTSDVHPYVAYDAQVDTFNQKSPTLRQIYITCGQHQLTEQQSQVYFSLLDSLITLSNVKNDALTEHLLFERAVAYSVIQNNESAIADLTTIIQSDSLNAMFFWQRAVNRSKQNAYMQSQGKDVTMQQSLVISDLSTAIRLKPQSPYLYYNRANAYVMSNDYPLAIADYTTAIRQDVHLAEAYYNRGLVYIHQKEMNKAIADLGKAGELGLYEAYSIIKKYTKQ